MFRALLLLCLVPLSDAPAAKPEALPFTQLLEAAREQARETNWKEAAKLWGEVVARNPVNGQYWQERARVCRRAEDYPAAIAAYQKCLELGQDFRWAMAYQIACCHALAGQKDEALTWLAKAKGWGHRSFGSALRDDDLKGLAADPRFLALFPPAHAKELSRDEGWRVDLTYYLEELKRRHWNPYRRFTPEQFTAFAAKLHADIPKLSDAEVEVRFSQLAAMAGDGHTHLRPARARASLPIQLYQFEEGVFVTAAAPERKELVGAELLAIGTLPTVDALKAVQPLISYDNAMGFKSVGPMLLTRPRLLCGLKVIPKEEECPLTFKLPTGETKTVTLPAKVQEVTKEWATARAGSKNPEPLYLKARDKAYWFEYLPEEKLVYLQYNAVRNEGKESFNKFCERALKFVGENEVERLVLDLRWNGGGNSFLNRPLIHEIIRCPKINQKGKLFVIIGRQTFSAAQNCTTDLEMHTNCIFVGEPSGSGPNMIGESIRVTLPFSGMTGTISDLYWGRSWPMDYRVWTTPELYAPPRFELYKENRDPALEALREYKKAS